jgi:polar amino acid transport system substrate-binding protein
LQKVIQRIFCFMSDEVTRMKKWMMAAAGAALMLSCAGQAMADQLQDIQKRGVLRVAVPQDFPPFGSVGTDLKPQGYDIDMAEYLAKEMKVKVELVPVTSANRVPYLQTNKVDLVISSLGKNAEREKVIDFSRAYAPFFLGVFGPKDATLADAAALSGKSIGVTRGAVEDMVLSDLAPKDAEVKRYEDNNTTISAYLSGQVQYMATGNVVVAAIARQNPEKAPVSKFMLKDSPCFIGLKKNEPALKAEVDKLIEQALKDGTLNNFSQKWMQAPLPATLGV